MTCFLMAEADEEKKAFQAASDGANLERELRNDQAPLLPREWREQPEAEENA